MRDTIAFALALLVISPAVGDEASRILGAAGDFSIEPPEGPYRTVSEQPLVLALPAVDGFAPNINVQVQPFRGSMAQYVNLTRAQVPAAGMELLAEPRIDGTRGTFEYAGVVEGRELRFYAAAEATEDRVYLVTATARRERWAEIAPGLRRSVDSFRLE